MFATAIHEPRHLPIAKSQLIVMDDLFGSNFCDLSRHHSGKTRFFHNTLYPLKLPNLLLFKGFCLHSGVMSVLSFNQVRFVFGHILLSLFASTAFPNAVVSQDFFQWLAQVRGEAASNGISQSTLDAAFADLEPIPRVIELDRSQPEFTLTFSRYLRSAVSEKRVATGRERLRQHAALLNHLENKYGIPARFLVAVWGLETNYGQAKGAFPVIGATATLYFDGRRESLFRRELFDALTILEQGHVSPQNMMGSWAGAMGHTQFMPSNFLAYAVDEDGDGRKDVWNTIPDALSSAANYLNALGWQSGFTWGREVRLPENFDYDLVSVETRARSQIRSLDEWAMLGVRRTNGRPLPGAQIDAALVVPQGADGPAFLVYDNYRVILDWNLSSFYGLAVGHLADRLGGAGPLAAGLKDESPLARSDVISLQEGLIALGHLQGGGADGVLGSGTRTAVKSFQKSSGLVADGYADQEIMRLVRERSGSLQN